MPTNTEENETSTQDPLESSPDEIIHRKKAADMYSRSSTKSAKVPDESEFNVHGGSANYIVRGFAPGATELYNMHFATEYITISDGEEPEECETPMHV